MLWKEISEFPGYFVSNTGLVKSTKYCGSFKRLDKNGILKQRTDRAGYKFVNLYKNGHMYSIKVHRLVALYFIPNPYDYPQINHKDENKGNNVVNNLEWCDSRYNLAYNGLQPRMHLKQKRKIGAYDNNMVLVKAFAGVVDAVAYLISKDITKTKTALCNICSAANATIPKKRYGYYWKWLEKSKRK